MKHRIALCLIVVGLPFAASAQTLTELGTVAAAETAAPSPLNAHAAAAPASPSPMNAIANAVSSKDSKETPSVAANISTSLFFTTEELNAIKQAISGYVAPATGTQGPAVVNAGPRVLKLAGIVYHSDNDWTIWFNGERVHPKNLPENVKGLIVKKDRIAIRWFDQATNKIISLVLRPHQQYNIDSDTIMAGTE